MSSSLVFACYLSPDFPWDHLKYLLTLLFNNASANTHSPYGTNFHIEKKHKSIPMHSVWLFPIHYLRILLYLNCLMELIHASPGSLLSTHWSLLDLLSFSKIAILCIFRPFAKANVGESMCYSYQQLGVISQCLCIIYECREMDIYDPLMSQSVYMGDWEAVFPTWKKCNEEIFEVDLILWHMQWWNPAGLHHFYRTGT